MSDVQTRQEDPGRPDLPAPNVPGDWVESRIWSTWGPALNVIRGEPYHQDELGAIVTEGPDRLGNPVKVTLVRNPDNPHDPNAIRAEIGERLVGYIARELAEVLAPALDAADCIQMSIAGKLRGGTYSDPIIDVDAWLDRRISPGIEIDMPEEIALRYLPTQRKPASLRWVPSRSDSIEKYFRLRDEIEQGWKARDFDHVIVASKETVGILDAVVHDVVEQEGAFWSHIPPAIEHGAPCMAVRADDVGLAEMRRVLGANEHLSHWLPDVELAVSDGVLAARLLRYVESHPKVIQKDLHAELDASKEAVQRVCWMLAQDARIKRESHGTSFSIETQTRQR